MKGDRYEIIVQLDAERASRVSLWFNDVDLSHRMTQAFRNKAIEVAYRVREDDEYHVLLDSDTVDDPAWKELFRNLED